METPLQKKPLLNIWFNFSGSLGYKEFWVQGTVIPWAILLTLLFAPKLLNNLGIANESLIILIQVLQSLMIIAMVWISVATTTKRLRDRNMTSWWYLLYFIPTLGTLILWTICCGPSATKIKE